MSSNSNIKQRPFNLLYRFEPQKSNIDVVYDFVTVQGRYIVVCVMFIIILAFIYRFPLDKKLNDEINRSNKNIRELQAYAPYQQEFKNVLTRTEGTKNYLKIYPSDFSAEKSGLGQPAFHSLYNKINATKLLPDFEKDIKIESYAYSAAPDGAIILTIRGKTTTFPKAEQFREKLRQEKGLFNDILITNLGSAKGDETPQFELNIKVRAQAQQQL
jgi:hypothetical protein